MNYKKKLLFFIFVNLFIISGCASQKTYCRIPPFEASLPKKPVGSMRIVEGIQIWSGGFPENTNYRIIGYALYPQNDIDLVKIAKENNGDAIIMTKHDIAMENFSNGVFSRKILNEPFLIKYLK